MIDYNTIFLDTAPLIYFLEKNDTYYDVMKRFFEEYGEADFVTSECTVAEYFTTPYRTGDLSLVDKFNIFTARMQMDIKDIDRTISEKAAHIRADYKHFKMMDAMQLAAAVTAGCDMFLTNDRQLLQFKEIPCVMVEDLF